LDDGKSLKMDGRVEVTIVLMEERKYGSGCEAYPWRSGGPGRKELIPAFKCPGHSASSIVLLIILHPSSGC